MNAPLETKIMSNVELTLRRRAIYTGMRPYFDDEKLLSAINLWQTEYSQKPKFALSVFIARCCDSPELKDERAKILKSIFMALELAPDALLPDPFVELKPANKALATAATDNPQQTVMFVTLLNQLFIKFNKVDEKQIRDSVLELLGEVKTDRMRMMYIREWFAKNTQTLEGQFDLDVLQKLVNICYMVMCQQLGPVKADQYLAQAIKETEPLASEAGFKLHDLL